MTEDLSPGDRAKRAAARRACDFVEDGMTLGLGTGSTAAWLVRHLGERVAHEGLRIRGVPTSRRTAELAREVGIEIVTLDEVPRLDLTIDGADEFDGALNLIKGGGGALLREKIVASASDRMIVIADASKEVARLGAFPLPVEVVPFGRHSTRRLVEECVSALDLPGDNVTLRMDGDVPFLTDEGNHILDLHLGQIGDPRPLARALGEIAGVVEHGLFLDLCDTVVMGHPDERVELREGGSGPKGRRRSVRRGRDNIFSDLDE
ncbi:ribose-5-phosphate isomerase RpiA [Palleronia sp. LCG004]|uniref:ribose-5-phosphate isomerase RpiA n=1 Tax=Palleronia sp. LCG004 TaxID=3079304 RepID=UPI002943E7E2|nr:ribose-5-phosphate isomerase RpiA [Palleronia sp. LCG004]WOI55658.1 ribose-5-phosphate isomerase RpiA [Palleronia sp. LCG004]